MIIKEGSIGTIIIGVIFVLLGVTNLNGIVASVEPTDWKGLLRQERLEFTENTDQLRSKLKKDLFENKITQEQWEMQNNDLLMRISMGQMKISSTIEELKNIESIYFLMSFPARLFIYEILCMWLIVVGLGLCIVFPWSRWFVILSACVSFGWQTYTYFYDQKVTETLIYFQTKIDQILNLPARVPLPSYLDFRSQFEFMQTFIFFGILYYLSLFEDQSLSKRRKKAPKKSDKEQTHIEKALRPPPKDSNS